MGRARGCQPLSSPGRPRPGPGGLDSLSRKQHTPPDPELLVPGPAYTGQLTALSQQDRPGPPRPRQDGPAGGATARPDISHLLAPTVEGRLHLPPGLGHVAFLQERKIVRVLEGDFELLVVSLFQGVQEVLGEPSFGNETRSFKRAAHIRGCRGGLGTGAAGAPGADVRTLPPRGPVPSASKLPRGQELRLSGPLDGMGLPRPRLLLCPFSVNGTTVDTTCPAAPTALPLDSASALSQQPPVL